MSSLDSLIASRHSSKSSWMYSSKVETERSAWIVSGKYSTFPYVSRLSDSSGFVRYSTFGIFRAVLPEIRIAPYSFFLTNTTAHEKRLFGQSVSSVDRTAAVSSMTDHRGNQ